MRVLTIKLASSEMLPARMPQDSMPLQQQHQQQKKKNMQLQQKDVSTVHDSTCRGGYGRSSHSANQHSEATSDQMAKLPAMATQRIVQTYLATAEQNI
jgi:hypothetical protein